jgi:hypothetical protein
MRPSDDTRETVHSGQRPPEDRPEQSSTVEARRVTVPEAAEILGTTTDAVRSRMRRGKLKREEGADGTVYVVLEGGLDGRETVEDSRKTGESTVGNGPQTVEDGPLVESLRDQVSYLRDQLDQERGANRENRRLLAAALERIPELEAPRESSPDEARAATTASKDSGNRDVPPEPQEPLQRRSWLYRFFFGP